MGPNKQHCSKNRRWTVKGDQKQQLTKKWRPKALDQGKSDSVCKKIRGPNLDTGKK